MTTFHPYSSHPFTPQTNFASHSRSGGSASPETDEGVGKAKIAKWSEEGPVKNACLSCRNKKAKCDGQQPLCGQCEKKSLECLYVKSRRGGARKKRGVAVPSALQEFLKKLDSLLAVPDFTRKLSLSTLDPTDDMTNIVRLFESRDEILRCYYNEVHPFLPVLPPRRVIDSVLRELLPESPFLLAAQAVLVLYPHPQDPNPKSAASRRLRCAMSNHLGTSTMDLIERTLEHPTIETVQALCILSLWEWGNAGDLHKSRSRSEQAVQVAMELGIHEMDMFSNSDKAVEGEDWKRDMMRRTWWQVYAAQLQSALVSGISPVLGPDDSRVKVLFPVCSVSDNSWINWINTIRQCSRVFAIVNAVYYSEYADGAAWGSRPEKDIIAGVKADMERQVVEIDRQVMDLMKQAERTAIIELVPGGEEEVVRNQQTAARLGLATTHIHIHRYQAFPEVSLFSKKICGLPQAPDFSVPMPMIDEVAVPQALANGHVPMYDESPAYKAVNATINRDYKRGHYTDRRRNSSMGTLSGLDVDIVGGDFDFIDEMWQPDTYPEDLPAPWFTHAGGAASFSRTADNPPNHHPPFTASIAAIPSPSSDRPTSVASASTSKPHKAWGVDDNDKPDPDEDVPELVIFPPGISLARCATAAHTIVRLEVLHRSASIAMSEGPPKWMPFCACGLVNGAYAFLLLALAVQAENTFGDRSDKKADEVEALLTNVRVLLGGLEAYGVMWSGIDIMAGEVRAALEAATRLPYEIRAQIESASPTA